MVAEGIDAKRLVFVDECGTHTSLAPIYGWTRKGERLSKKVPRNRGKNTALRVSITYGGMGCLVVEGATTKANFEAYLERVLGPTLSLGQVVVMDNLAAHKGERVRELIEGRGCELLYLPPYSPDLNLIEQAFAKVKALLRRATARSREAFRDDRRCPGRSRLLRALWLPHTGPALMTNALVLSKY